MVKKSNNILTNLFTESDAYNSIESIERLLQQGMDLTNHPLQPLYLSLKSLPAEKTAYALTKLSKEQRAVFLDLDLWEKDDLDLENFSYWIQSYSVCPDEKIRLEFIKSSEFALFLKSRVNIWTFDAEDPHYPDHDNYFLTDDNLLLVEYDDQFEDINIIKNMIRELYGRLGVEEAYAYLFKIVSDSFLQMQEQEYQHKKGRLSDVGLVDYYDALEINNCFPNIVVLNNFIEKRISLTAEIDSYQKNQILHSSALVAYRKDFNSIIGELDKVEDKKRLDYLHFNFIRLVNATLALDNAIKDGPVAMTRVGNVAKSLIELGHSYIVKMIGPDCKLFESFDFVDIYRVGNTLINNGQKEIKKSLRSCSFDQGDESFLGGHLLEFVDNSLERPTKFSPNRAKKAWIITDSSDYYQWKNRVDLFCSLIPFVRQLYFTFRDMKTSGRLQDDYYLNYAVTEIDFEAILLSSFANFLNGKGDDENKMGLTLDEFKSFALKVIDSKGKLKEIKEFVSSFANVLGLDRVDNFYSYMHNILSEQLEGYEYSKLTQDDYKHVGGPVILNS